MRYQNHASTKVKYLGLLIQDRQCETEFRRCIGIWNVILQSLNKVLWNYVQNEKHRSVLLWNIISHINRSFNVWRFVTFSIDKIGDYIWRHRHFLQKDIFYLKFSLSLTQKTKFKLLTSPIFLSRFSIVVYSVSSTLWLCKSLRPRLRVALMRVMRLLLYINYNLASLAVLWIKFICI